MLLKDVRDYQILFLSLFLFLGIWTRDWTLRPDLILVVMITCLVTQSLAVSIKQNLFNLLPVQDNCPNEIDSGLTNVLAKLSLRSALITALGLSLLLRADSYSTMILAGSFAIISKFIFNFRNKHFFNPANFGIIAALILTKDAWVSPGQWGDEWWYALLFAGTGGTILKRVGRWDTTAAFLGSYAFLEAIRNIWLGWTWDVFLHRLMSGSLLLFALFMITDPRSIPNARIGRLVWAVSIGCLTFLLRNQFFVSTAVFWALFALAPLTIFLDFIWTAPRFSWGENPSPTFSNLVINKSEEIESETYLQA
ncbi:RnfABCDGE type electron transport complex subunit D [Coleofasciculus sp. FACHB-1120]|uniref:RnfABCDGE type electron transport complex subunit D n=1 Tax=Coleofasciculus sp. FACHB-1120 TaxID=2692783 RepID=UPI001682E0DC|nr:RnfABCDGE type electron transport complex subunit D [Coleofasciculus sp. FACHB-1120]MBD2742989.1 RnfABCDGE type electron transport complex subunit D [Coleofasciculus sp. FACHB-1120]